MEGQAILFLLTVGAIIVLVACGVKGGMEWLLGLLMRGLLGAVGIHFVNAIVAHWGFVVGIGINPLSFLTVSFLGIPGFVGLYLLEIYQHM